MELFINFSKQQVKEIADFSIVVTLVLVFMSIFGADFR